jgi:inositol hexakisphosphate/diphosphoinositol-pentakisphosphate kinase
MICGFDLLRVGDKSYVIDGMFHDFVLLEPFLVNGWSFVKGNESYYDKVSAFLKDSALRYMETKDSVEMLDIGDRQVWSLKGYMSVLRHADRTPKQKWKGKFKSKLFLNLMNGGKEELALRKADQLEGLLQTAYKAKEEGVEDPDCLDYLVNILQLKKDTEGTKVQLRPVFKEEDEGEKVLKSIQLIIKWGGMK